MAKFRRQKLALAAVVLSSIMLLVHLNRRASNLSTTLKDEMLEKKDTFDPHQFNRSARAEFIREMTRHAWKGYREYAVGFDFLLPISRKGANMNNKFTLDLTLHDSFSTLKIMGLEAEFGK